MGKYCVNCGKELHTGARFCAKCGTTVLDAPSAETTPAVPPSRLAPPPPKTELPPQSNTASAAPKRQKSTKAIKRNGGHNALCIVLSVLLVVQMAAVALYGWPGLSVGDGIKLPSVQESSRFTLEEGQTFVKTDSGVTVDFGPYNAMDGEKVVIKEMSSDNASVEGGIRTAYSISAGERSGFDGLLTITLPYDESETDATDEEGSVFAEYLNEETGEWELVDYTVNTADNTVAITTDHLSDYCTVTMRDAGAPYALLSKFSSKRLGDETAMAILSEYEQTGQPGEVGDSLLRSFYSQFLPMQYQQYPANDEAELVNEVLGWLSDVSELAAQGGGYKQVANVMEKSGYMLLGLSALSLGDTMYDAYRGEESAEAVAAEAYKLAYSFAVTWLDFKKITTGTVQLSMLGVIALDYSLNQFMLAADQTYKDALFNVVIAYNEEIHPWTDAEWYARIMGLYKNRGDDPEKFNAGLRGLMENYSSRYFYDTPEEQHVATNQAGLHAYTTGLLPETDAAKEYCIEQYMARLGQKLQPVLEDVVERIRYDSRKSFSSNAHKLRQALNAPLEFEIVEEIPDGEKSKYAGCVVVLSRPGGQINEGWTAILNDEGRVTIDATIVGYIGTGMPTQLRLWNKGDYHYEDDPALTQEFPVTEKITVISLGNTGIDARWFEGSWRYGDNIAFTIEIIDDQNCRHISTLDGEQIVHETTYVFDPATATLTTAYSPGRVSLLETVYYGEMYEGVDYIEIKRTSGSTLYERAK